MSILFAILVPIAFVAISSHIAGLFCLRCMRFPRLEVKYKGNAPDGISGLHAMYQICGCGEKIVDTRTV